MVRRRLLAIGAVLVAAACLLAGSAGAATVRVGTLVLQADGGFEPQALPRRTYAPIHFQGHGLIKTTDGSQPPALQHVKIDFDRDGRLTTAGLPVCQPAELEGTTTAQARQRCGDAIVGGGQVSAAVTLLGLARIELSAPLTIFNGPRRDGHPTVIGHARAPFPVSETYVVVAPIERLPRGVFGYRTSFEIPPIAGGAGSLTRIAAKVGRTYRVHGKQRSFISAHCSDGILQTQGYFSFADGTVVSGSVFKVCHALP